MTAYELIKAKRDGQALAAEDIHRLMQAYAEDKMADYQMAAFLMAVFFRGFTPPELDAWTAAMLHSGEVLDLSDIPGIKVDKHSTGGVGDKVSLALAPLAAACGVKVPMISGRGLGHTGGTLDKLQSIAGFRVDLPVAEYRRLVQEVGACLVGQSAALAPADKRLYALRDVTATVDCIPLIASSIMSKKLAEGIDALVLDVKVGSGAFMKRPEDARALAAIMIEIGRTRGVPVVALLTDMDQPLGRAVGNALEVEEAVAMLRGDAPEDFTELTFALTAEMLVLARRTLDLTEARAVLKQAVASGNALQKFKEIVTAQGGDARAVDDVSRLPRARYLEDLEALEDGWIASMDAEAVGRAAVALGAGRQKVDDAIDPAVGFVLLKKRGERVKRGEGLVRIHHNGARPLPDIRERLRAAFRIGSAAEPVVPLVLERLTSELPCPQPHRGHGSILK